MVTIKFSAGHCTKSEVKHTQRASVKLYQQRSQHMHKAPDGKGMFLAKFLQDIGKSDNYEMNRVGDRQIE